MSLSMGLGPTEMDTYTKGFVSLTSEGLELEGVGKFSNPLGLLISHMTTLNYSRRTGRSIKLKDFQAYGYEAGDLSRLFEVDEAFLVPEQEAFTRDMIVIEKLRKSDLLPHVTLLDTIASGLTPSDMAAFVEHRKNNPTGIAIYGLVKKKEAISIEEAMSLPMGKHPGYSLRTHRLTDDPHFCLLYHKKNPSRVPLLDEFVGSRIKAPITSKEVLEILKGPQALIQETKMLSQWDWMQFNEVFKKGTAEEVMQLNTYHFEKYCTETYVNPGSKKTTRISRLLASMGAVGTVYTPRELYDLLFSLDGVEAHVPVWYYRCRGAFRVMDGVFHFTNSKAVKLEKGRFVKA